MDIANSIRRYVTEDTMVSKNGMTIRDYLARHTLTKDLLKRWNAAIKGPRDGNDPFARLLQSSLSHSSRKVNRAIAGMTAAVRDGGPDSRGRDDREPRLQELRRELVEFHWFAKVNPADICSLHTTRAAVLLPIRGFTSQK